MYARHLLLTAALVLAAAGAGAQDAATRGPGPELEPREVVEAMLLAMRKNSDAGIAELYRFSSPGNRAQTGSLERFRQLMRASFADLLGHRSAQIAPALVDGGRAMLPVELLDSDGAVHRYIFLLSRLRTDECADCWLADAVFSPYAEDGGDSDDGDEAAPARSPALHPT